VEKGSAHLATALIVVFLRCTCGRACAVCQAHLLVCDRLLRPESVLAAVRGSSRLLFPASGGVGATCVIYPPPSPPPHPFHTHTPQPLPLLAQPSPPHTVTFVQGVYGVQCGRGRGRGGGFVGCSAVVVVVVVVGIAPTSVLPYLLFPRPCPGVGPGLLMSRHVPCPPVFFSLLFFSLLVLVLPPQVLRTQHSLVSGDHDAHHRLPEGHGG
jgi:hypothetical protein